jgi:hypothetical protein
MEEVLQETKEDSDFVKRMKDQYPFLKNTKVGA